MAKVLLLHAWLTLVDLGILFRAFGLLLPDTFKLFCFPIFRYWNASCALDLISTLGTDHLTCRGGGGGGGMVFFLKKYSDSKCCWKKYSDFGGGKKKSDSEFLSYNLMLNSGGEKFALCATKKNILTRVVRKNISEWSKKP